MPASHFNLLAPSADFSTLISIADKVDRAGRIHLLRTFVIYYFRSATVKTKSFPEDETVHSALCKYVTLHVSFFCQKMHPFFGEGMNYLIYGLSLVNLFFVRVAVLRSRFKQVFSHLR